MAKTGVVTYEAVAKVADEMARAGVTPTQRALVERVGGSNSTVGPHLRRWKQGRDAASTQGETVRHIEVEVAVASVIRRAQDAVRAELQGDLDDQVREIEQLTAERESALGQVVELTTTAAGLQRQVDQQAGQLSEVRRELDESRAARASAEAALETLRGEHSRAEQARAALEERVAQLQAGAERDAQGLREAQRRAETAVAGQAAAEQSLATTRAEYDARLDVERRARAELEQRMAALRETIDGHLPKLERLAAAEASERLLREQVTSLNEALQAAREQTASLTGILQQPDYRKESPHGGG